MLKFCFRLHEHSKSTTNFRRIVQQVGRTHVCDVMCSCTAELLLSKYFLQMLKYNCGSLCGGQSVTSVTQSCPTLCNPMDAACQASLYITNSRSSLKLISIESVMPSSHLILCRPLILLTSIPPRIRVFSNESTLRIRWPKYWSFSFSISPSKGIGG